MQSSRSHQSQGRDFSPGLQTADLSTPGAWLEMLWPVVVVGQLEGRRCLKVLPELLRVGGLGAPHPKQALMCLQQGQAQS